jgi:hypothetical protein
VMNCVFSEFVVGIHGEIGLRVMGFKLYFLMIESTKFGINLSYLTEIKQKWF